MILTGSNDNIIFSYTLTTPPETLNQLEEQYGLRNDNVVLISCARCGKITWKASHNARYCSDECLKAATKEHAKALHDKTPKFKGSKLSDLERKMYESYKMSNDEESNDKVYHKLYEYNTLNACSCYASKTKSVCCMYCKKGVDYVTGTKDISSRCCSAHPIAGDGSRFIYGTAYRKNPSSSRVYPRLNMHYSNTQYIEVPLGTRSGKVDTEGNVLLLDRKGRVTKYAVCDNKLRKICEEESNTCEDDSPSEVSVHPTR